MKPVPINGSLPKYYPVLYIGYSIVIPDNMVLITGLMEP